LHSVFAEFGSWRVTDQGGQACRAYWNSQDDAIVALQEDMRDVLWRSRHSLNAQAFSE
jgi:hypothetical protein